MTFEDWFQLRLDSLLRQKEWRKIDCLLESKEYVRDAWEYVPSVYQIAPIEPTGSKCAQCKKPYKNASKGIGCPKCAPGIKIDEVEFQKPITAPQETK